jgi:hypothetical protein
MKLELLGGQVPVSIFCRLHFVNGLALIEVSLLA